jgi:cytidyltransferase-like protein
MFYSSTRDSSWQAEVLFRFLARAAPSWLSIGGSSPYIRIETSFLSHSWHLQVSVSGGRAHGSSATLVFLPQTSNRVVSLFPQLVNSIVHHSAPRAGEFIVTAMGGVGVLLATSGYILFVPGLSEHQDWVSQIGMLVMLLSFAVMCDDGSSKSFLPKELRRYSIMSAAAEASDMPRFSLSRAGWKGYEHAATGGCYDGFHDGHRAYLTACMSLCDRLTVFLNTDRSVRGLKGPGRPVQSLGERRSLISKFIRPDDRVEAFTVKDAHKKIGDAHPDIFFKGSDYWLRKIPEAQRSRPPTPVLIVDSIIEMHTSEIYSGGVGNDPRQA